MLGAAGERERKGEAWSAEGLTRSKLGTPGYSAPEQREASPRVDSRADIHSLGVVFYELLTGELPGKPLQPPSRKVQIDVRLDEVVLRALEQEPELRYQKASLLKTQLETIAATPAAATQERVGQLSDQRVDLSGVAPSHRLGWVAILAGMLIVVLIVVIWANNALHYKRYAELGYALYSPNPHL